MEHGEIQRTYLPEGQRGETHRETAPYFSKSTLIRAAEHGEILESVVIRCDEALTLHVDLGSMPGRMERGDVTDDSQGGEKEIAIITRVGKVVCFKVLGFGYDENGNEYAKLSRAAAQKECRYKFLSKLQPGDVIPAKVTHLEPFGAFVDIGCGCVSLLPIDCISVARISHPSDRFSVGMSIYVVVKSIDRQTARIYVTHKELLGTWEENASAFSVGQTVRGIVRSIEDYGIFIELTPNLAGLAEYRAGLHVGQCVAVYIKNIIPYRMKMKLVIVDTDQMCAPKKHFEYCIPKWHMDFFQYSPTGSDRIIQTVFCETQPCRNG